MQGESAAKPRKLKDTLGPPKANDVSFSSAQEKLVLLHYKRALNKSHIEKLSKRFEVSPAVFF